MKVEEEDVQKKREKHPNRKVKTDKRQSNASPHDQGLHGPTLPVAAQQAKDLPLAHGVFAGELQDSAAYVVAVEGVGVGGGRAGEFEADAVRQLLLVEVGSVGSFEVGEVEFLAGAGL